MNNEDRNGRNDAYEKFRGTLHVAMGVLYLVIGSLVLYVKYFGAMELSSGIAYTLGTMMLLYGLFRLWRGITYMRQQKHRS
jgi:hypothetical protein